MHAIKKYSASNPAPITAFAGFKLTFGGEDGIGGRGK